MLTMLQDEKCICLFARPIIKWNWSREMWLVSIGLCLPPPSISSAAPTILPAFITGIYFPSVTTDPPPSLSYPHIILQLWCAHSGWQQPTQSSQEAEGLSTPTRALRHGTHKKWDREWTDGKMTYWLFYNITPNNTVVASMTM